MLNRKQGDKKTVDGAGRKRCVLLHKRF